MQTSTTADHVEDVDGIDNAIIAWIRILSLCLFIPPNLNVFIHVQICAHVFNVDEHLQPFRSNHISCLGKIRLIKFRHCLGWCTRKVPLLCMFIQLALYMCAWICVGVCIYMHGQVSLRICMFFWWLHKSLKSKRSRVIPFENRKFSPLI